MTDTIDTLRIAVNVIWRGCGEVPPTGANLDRAAANLANALASGRKVERIDDKTFQPLYGPRRDLE